jgi:hypothetical protein
MKNKKPIAVDVLFKAYPMVPLMQIQSERPVLLNSPAHHEKFLLECFLILLPYWLVL